MRVTHLLHLIVHAATAMFALRVAEMALTPLADVHALALGGVRLRATVLMLVVAARLAHVPFVATVHVALRDGVVAAQVSSLGVVAATAKPVHVVLTTGVLIVNTGPDHHVVIVVFASVGATHIKVIPILITISIIYEIVLLVIVGGLPITPLIILIEITALVIVAVVGWAARAQVLVTLLSTVVVVLVLFLRGVQTTPIVRLRPLHAMAVLGSFTTIGFLH